MKNTKQVLALAMAVAMAAGLLAGCGSSASSSAESVASGEATSEAAATDTGSSDGTLVLADTGFEGKFSPFFAASSADQHVIDLTNIALLGADRKGEMILKGIEGETREYNGTDYTYYGPADCEVTENADGTVTYAINMRDDLVFADGTPITIDDVIFNLYVYMDPTYDGSATLYSMPIAGLDDYRSSMTTLSKLDNYEEARWQHYVDTIPCRIYLLSEDPDGLNGINQEKMAKSQQRLYPTIRKYRDQIENKYQWCIAAVPGAAWAKKLFPGLRTSQAMEKLWEAILSTSRVDEDPLAAWDAHNQDLHDRCQYLNSLHLRQLKYKSANGTDLTVGLIPEGQFCGGGETSLQGIFFNPNIPTEECFISPKRGEAEGIVYATKPLSYQGQLIDKFWIRFHEGKAVEWHAEQNDDLLTKLITMDEGSAYLGECALVPYDSPIRQSGLLFYNTLFDENAACHLALGMGFADTINDFEHKTLAECRALDVNDSMIHEDFMIGSEDMDIDAVCENGDVVPVFRHGNWAF